MQLLHSNAHAKHHAEDEAIPRIFGCNLSHFYSYLSFPFLRHLTE
jgi:hypothetical protein